MFYVCRCTATGYHRLLSKACDVVWVASLYVVYCPHATRLYPPVLCGSGNESRDLMVRCWYGELRTRCHAGGKSVVVACVRHCKVYHDHAVHTSYVVYVSVAVMPHTATVSHRAVHTHTYPPTHRQGEATPIASGSIAHSTHTPSLVHACVCQPFHSFLRVAILPQANLHFLCSRRHPLISSFTMPFRPAPICAHL